MEDHIQKHKREQAARISNSYNIPTLIEKAESSDALEKGGIGSGRKRGDYVVHKNPITGRLHEGRLHSEDKDGKYHHIRTTTGDLEYVESKHTTDASPQKADQIHRIMNERKFADGKSYNDEFKKAEDSDFEVRGREYIERYLSPGEIEKARISQNLQECYSIDSLEKGKKADIGEIRTWGGVKYVKHQDGWVTFNQKTGRGSVYGSDGKKKMDVGEHHKEHYNKHYKENEKKDHKDPLKEMGYSDSDIEDFLDEYAAGGSKVPEKVREVLDKRFLSNSPQKETTKKPTLEEVDTAFSKVGKALAEGRDPDAISSLENKTAKELRSYLMGSEFPNDAKIRIQEKIGYADTTVKELRDRLYNLQDQNIPAGIKSIELIQDKEDTDQAIHEDSKKIASAAGISEEEFKKLHPDTKKELLNNSKKESPFKSSEGSFTNDEDERLSYRVYDDGAVKITGANVRKDFNTKEEAAIYVRKVGFNDPDHIEEGISKKE